MSLTTPWIFALGFAAQLLFATRMVVQWISSERANHPLSPLVFWQFSLGGSLLFMVYGLLRQDLAIVLGQLLVYPIYLRNLALLRQWRSISGISRMLLVAAPLLALFLFARKIELHLSDLLTTEQISLPLKIWGSLGQFVFILRFYVQWIDSERRRESQLSSNFWWVSLAGSLMILSYAVVRLDPVLALGQLAGLFFYIRNIQLEKRQFKAE